MSVSDLGLTHSEKKKIDYRSTFAQPFAWFVLIADEDLKIDAHMDFIEQRGELWGKYTGFCTQEKFFEYVRHPGVQYARYGVEPPAVYDHAAAPRIPIKATPRHISTIPIVPSSIPRHQPTLEKML